ncbi:MAG TPA: hypothetical protein VI522_03580 [Gammaproteobacteria bacterium]|nr:hypothetical protein [Gammaproteobacteria bacterium]
MSTNYVLGAQFCSQSGCAHYHSLALLGKIGMPTTQDMIKIDAIRDGVAILKGGALRGVLRVSSINFALKSEDEQNAVIFAFQNFLNSLDFEIQIFVSSRFLNIDDYLASLEEIENKQQNELLRIQTQEYRKFVKEFVESANIVSTDFFVVVPFSLYEAQAGPKGGGVLEQFTAALGFGTTAHPTQMDPARFSHYRGQLLQRMDFVASGLQRMGLVTKPLDTEELIVLFWNLYNPQGLKKRTLMKGLMEKY